MATKGTKAQREVNLCLLLILPGRRAFSRKAFMPSSMSSVRVRSRTYNSWERSVLFGSGGRRLAQGALGERRTVRSFC
jgi:hypothetical protein